MKTKTVVLSILIIAGIFLIIYSVSQQDSDDSIKKMPVVVGLNAPSIELVDAKTGNKVLSSEFNGKVVFINFWATWCTPCQEEMPSIEKLHNRFKDNKDFLLITILFRDEADAAVKYMNKNKYSFPLMIDNGFKAAKAYGVTGVPETYIVDKKGVLKKKVLGPYEWDSEDVITYISGLLKS